MPLTKRNLADALTRFRSATVASTTNVSITTLAPGVTIDGITLVAGDVVLLKDQLSTAQNGIYMIGTGAGATIRQEFYNEYDDHPGLLLTIERGTTQASTVWQCTSTRGGTLDQTSIVFAQFGTSSNAALKNADNTWTVGQTFPSVTVLGSGAPTNLTIRASASQSTTDLTTWKDAAGSNLAYLNVTGIMTATEFLSTVGIVKFDTWQWSVDVSDIAYLRDTTNTRNILAVTPGTAGNGTFQVNERVVISSPAAGNVVLSVNAISGQTANIFLVKNGSNTNVFAVAADGTINQSGEIVHSGNTGLNHNSKWREYSPDTEFYVRDLSNGRMHIQLSPGNSNLNANTAINSKLQIGGGAAIKSSLSATTTWDPSSVADGAMTSTTVTVTGAAVGDECTCGFSNAVPAGAILSASVTASNTVTVTLFNKTGSPLDLSSGTLRASTWSR